MQKLAEIDLNRRELFANSVSPIWYIENPKVFEEDDPHYLCGNCRHIDFALLTNKGQSSYATCSDANLGRVQDIIQKQKCPSCRLVVQSVCIAGGFDRPPMDFHGQSVSYRLRRLRPARHNSTCDLSIIMTPWPPLGPVYVSCRIRIFGEALFEGRRITENQANFQLIKEHIRLCEAGVPGPRLGHDESQPSIAGFRVIDVADR